MSAEGAILRLRTREIAVTPLAARHRWSRWAVLVIRHDTFREINTCQTGEREVIQQSHIATIEW